MQLPSPYEFTATPAWQAAEFISDLHLSPDRPRTTEAWARYLTGTDADIVFILGDLFEVWVGDDASEPGSFEAEALGVLQEAATHRHLAFMAGNRDFLVGGQALRTAGAIALRDPTLFNAWGHRVLLTHGDLLCLDDEPYQRFREQVRSEAWRHEFLARPLDERRRLARQMRDASEKRKADPEAGGGLVDIDIPAAIAWMHACGSRELVHGHTHQPRSEVVAPGFARHVLTDWELDATPRRAEALRLTRDGFERRPLVD